MTDLNFRNRQPAGIRTGGQFATEPKTETTVTLTTATTDRGHERGCLAQAVGRAVQNIRDRDGFGDAVTEGEASLADGTTPCYCGTDPSDLPPWAEWGEEQLNERAEYERQIAEEAARYAGQPSVDDFTPEQRKVIESVQRHSFEWAARQVGLYGMETFDYAEDYSCWVARRYMGAGCDDDALGSHEQMVKLWDAERAANAATQIAVTGAQKAWVDAMSNGARLSRQSMERGADTSGRREFYTFLRELGRRGVMVDQVRDTDGEFAWTISSLEGETFQAHVPTGR